MRKAVNAMLAHRAPAAGPCLASCAANATCLNTGEYKNCMITEINIRSNNKDDHKPCVRNPYADVGQHATKEGVHVTGRGR